MLSSSWRNMGLCLWQKSLTVENLGRILNCLCVDGGGSGNAKKQSGTTSRQEPTACDAPKESL